MFTTDDEKSQFEKWHGELPIFQSIGELSDWFESAADQLAENDLVGMEQLRSLWLQEIRKIYARWEEEFSRPTSPDDRAEIEEDFRLMGLTQADHESK